MRFVEYSKSKAAFIIFLISTKNKPEEYCLGCNGVLINIYVFINL